MGAKLIQNNWLELIKPEKVVIEKGIKKIDYQAFNNCELLEEVIFPVGVGKIDNADGWGDYLEGGIFCGCSNLKAIYVPSKKADYYKDRLDSKRHGVIVEMEPENKAKKTAKK